MEQRIIHTGQLRVVGQMQYCMLMVAQYRKLYLDKNKTQFFGASVLKYHFQEAHDSQHALDLFQSKSVSHKTYLCYSFLIKFLNERLEEFRMLEMERIENCVLFTFD